MIQQLVTRSQKTCAFFARTLKRACHVLLQGRHSVSCHIESTPERFLRLTSRHFLDSENDRIGPPRRKKWDYLSSTSVDSSPGSV
ncbi:hypothetical protein TNCV_2016601 [Trichonephila clavipes]|nr:hypothetical protein TNCV_2016601 [Trichonephila clavipes]